MTKRQELIDFMVWMGLDRDLAIVEADQYLADHSDKTERSCKTCRHRYKSDLNCGHCDLSIFSNWKSQKQVERSCKTCGIPESTYWHPRCHGCGEEYNHWKPKI